MSTKLNTEGKVSSNYPENFNARETRLITHNYAAVIADVADETVDVAPGDGITHVVVQATGCTVNLPNPKLSKGRLIKVFVAPVAVSATISQEGVPPTALDEGVYELLCAELVPGVVTFETVSFISTAPIP